MDVWILSHEQESNYWEAESVYATPELAMKTKDEEDRTWYRKRLERFNEEYPPEMKQSEGVEKTRRHYIEEMEEDEKNYKPLKWIPEKDKDGKITGYVTKSYSHQIAPFKVIGL